MVDTGADKSYMGGRAVRLCESLNILIDKFTEPQCVQLADQSTAEVMVSVKIPIELQGKTHLITCLILPNSCVDVIIGLHSLYRLGVVLNPADRSWYYQSCPEENFQFVDDVVDRSMEMGGNVVDTIATVAKLSNYQKTKLATFLNSELPCFDRVSGHTTAIQHTIKTGDAEPIKQRYYPVTPVIQQVINEEIDKLLKEGAMSAWSSPIVMVKKPNDEYGMCLDFRKVNAVTKKDSYRLPYIEDILRKLRSAKFISTIDLKNGYWQVPLEPSSREKTAFTVPGRGLFQFVVMPFGLCNAPATFQRLLDMVLKEEMGDRCFCYMDDIVVISEEFSEHLKVLGKILQKLRAAGLKINNEKSQFCRSELKYLGHVVTTAGIAMGPGKVSTTVNCPTPRNVKELKFFLGLVSWYRKYVPNFADIFIPLTRLLKKN
jgi:hypothetical protein